MAEIIANFAGKKVIIEIPNNLEKERIQYGYKINFRYFKIRKIRLETSHSHRRRVKENNRNIKRTMKNLKLQIPQTFLKEEVRCGYTVNQEMKKTGQ